ncbi:MAG: hypothetical protein JWQ29_1860 [Phenylobacterium sp.]|nr:hypothetical protein [Phenylobacterium sp.]
MSAKLILTTLTTAAALGLATHVSAAPARNPFVDGERISVRVPAGDLDLQREAGAKVLLQRIHRAANFICGESYGVELARYVRHRQCMRTVVDDAVNELRNPVVSELNARPPQRRTMILAASR